MEIEEKKEEYIKEIEKIMRDVHKSIFHECADFFFFIYFCFFLIYNRKKKECRSRNVRICSKDIGLERRATESRIINLFVR
jgi:hypothetical protein